MKPCTCPKRLSMQCRMCRSREYLRGRRDALAELATALRPALKRTSPRR